MMTESAGEELRSELDRLAERDRCIFDFLQAVCVDGIWYLDLHHDGAAWLSPRFVRALGFEPGDVADPWNWLRSRVDAGDFGRLMDDFEEAAVDPPGPLDHILRLRHKDGSIRWMRSRSLILEDDLGKPTRVLAAQTDVTEIKRLEAELEGANETLVEQGYELLRREQQAGRLALRDGLTGLGNRRAFDSALKLAITESDCEDSRFALFVIDIDHFKEINDTLGHVVGDELIRKIAHVIQSSVRGEDVVCRIGGDEFCIIQYEIDSMRQAQDVADRLIEALKQRVEVDRYELFSSVTIGIALSDPGLDGKELLRQADTALYHAKETRRGAYVFHSEAISKRAFREFDLISDLKKALQEEGLPMLYQPQFAVDGTLVGAETLLEWRHRGERIPSSEFMPLLEKYGYVSEARRVVLQELAGSVEKAVRGNILRSISHKLTEVGLREPKLCEKMLRELDLHGMEPVDLCFEISEDAFAESDERTQRTIRELFGAGFGIVIDDFGGHLASTRHLSSPHVQAVKISAELMKETGADGRYTILLEAIMQFADAFGVDVIAHGVETEQQFEMLKACGCKWFQGSYFADFMPLTDLLRLADSASPGAFQPASRAAPAGARSRAA